MQNALFSKKQSHIHPHPTHDWLKQLVVGYHPTTQNPLLDHFAPRLLNAFRELGHETHTESPPPNTNVVLASAKFGEPINWRRSMMLLARKRLNLTSQPTVYTIVTATRQEVDTTLCISQG